jgi:hypothetical protein
MINAGAIATLTMDAINTICGSSLIELAQSSRKGRLAPVLSHHRTCGSACRGKGWGTQPLLIKPYVRFSRIRLSDVLHLALFVFRNLKVQKNAALEFPGTHIHLRSSDRA